MLLCLMLAACARKHTAVRYVPPEEAAWFKFKGSFPEEGRQAIPGPMVVAMQAAANHFLSWEARIPHGADAVDICIRQRQAWDVEIVSWDEQAMLVRFALSPGACRWGGAPLLDMGTTYAVRAHDGHILASSSSAPPPESAAPVQLPPELPRQGLQSIEGNSAAAIQLAAEAFVGQLPRTAENPSNEEACLARLGSYDVTAVSEPGGVALVRFDVDDERCPPPGPVDMVEGRRVLAPAFVTTYAIDIRTMRILGIDLSTRQRVVE
ncbi:MAG: hypothetical protein JXB05_00290 [Myxococcaceae bacterium]|nr:hypothetical protein [Myxococcaceae bacterium]